MFGKLFSGVCTKYSSQCNSVIQRDHPPKLRIRENFLERCWNDSAVQCGYSQSLNCFAKMQFTQVEKFGFSHSEPNLLHLLFAYVARSVEHEPLQSGRFIFSFLSLRRTLVIPWHTHGVVNTQSVTHTVTHTSVFIKQCLMIKVTFNKVRSSIPLNFGDWVRAEQNGHKPPVIK